MSINHSWKKTLFAVIKIAISIAILTLLYRKAQDGNQFSEIAQTEKNWTWIVVALFLCAAAHLISFYRWRILVNALEVPFTTLEAVRIGLIGSAFGLVSLGVVGGDSLRVVFAARDAKNKLAQIFGSVFVDRAIGLLTMFTFATGAYLLIDIGIGEADGSKKLSAIQLLCSIVSAATLSGWAVVLGFLLSPRLLGSRFVEKLKQLPKVGAIFQKLTDVVLLYRKQIPTLAYCLLLSIIVNLCFIATIYLIAIGLNVAHPSLDKHFLIAPISMCANAVPLPGGIGGMEPVLAFLHDTLSGAGETAKHGIVVAFCFRVTLLVVAALGAVAWFVNRKQIRSIVKEAEQDE